MNREQQIKEQAKTLMRAYESNLVNDTKRQAFIRGAKWADKHPASPWIPLDGKHKEPPYKRAIAVYYPLDCGRVDIVERSKKTGKPLDSGNYPDGLDEYGLPVLPESSRAAMLLVYTVRATMYMDITDPTKEEIEYANTARK